MTKQQTLAVLFKNKVHVFSSVTINGEELFDLYEIQEGLYLDESPFYLPSMYENEDVTLINNVMYGTFEVANDYIWFITEGDTKAINKPITVTINDESIELPSLFLNGEATYDLAAIHNHIYFGNEDIEPSKFTGSQHYCYVPKQQVLEYLNWVEGWVK